MAEYYVGEIRVFAGNYAPDPNWHFCDGTLLPISEYQLLFTVIGTTYGGDGRSTFQLPDLRGRLAVHRVKTAATGAQFALGNSGGTEAVALTTAQLPVHTHSFEASTTPATATAPGSTLVLATTAQPWLQYTPNTGQISTAAMAVAALTPVGGNQQHNNVMPGETINYIIALNGLYPSPAN